MANSNENIENSITYGQMNLINTLRKLWMELVMWRRAYLISFSSNLGDLDTVGKRLYQAPTDIGNVLSIFFGEMPARLIESLIREQILLWMEILYAEKTGNRELIDQNTKRLYENVDQMAAYLASINPYWDEQTWKRALHDYYEATLLEMIAQLSGKYQDAITLHESMENQALAIADYMAYGINRYYTGQ